MNIINSHYDIFKTIYYLMRKAIPRSLLVASFNTLYCRIFDIPISIFGWAYELAHLI